MILKVFVLALITVCLPSAVSGAIYPLTVIPTAQDNFRIELLSVAGRSLLFVPAGQNRIWSIFRESGGWQASSNTVPLDCAIGTLAGLSLTDKVHYLTTNNSTLVLGRLQEVASNRWSIETNIHLHGPVGRVIVSVLAVAPSHDAAVVRTGSTDDLFLLRSNAAPLDLGPLLSPFGVAQAAWSTNGILITRKQASSIEAILHNPTDGTIIRQVNLPMPTSLAEHVLNPFGIWTDENGTVYRRSSSLIFNDVTLNVLFETNGFSSLTPLEDGGVLVQNGQFLQRFHPHGGLVFSVQLTNFTEAALSPDGQFLLAAERILFGATGSPIFNIQTLFGNEQPNQGYRFFGEGTRMFLARANFFSDDVYIRELPLIKLTAMPLGANQLRLNWPATDYPFQLRSSANVAGAFSQISPTQFVSNGEISVTLSTTGSQAYFKLQMD